MPIIVDSGTWRYGIRTVKIFVQSRKTPCYLLPPLERVAPPPLERDAPLLLPTLERDEDPPPVE